MDDNFWGYPHDYGGTPHFWKIPESLKKNHDISPFDDGKYFTMEISQIFAICWNDPKGRPTFLLDQRKSETGCFPMEINAMFGCVPLSVQSISYYCYEVW